MAQLCVRRVSGGPVTLKRASDASHRSVLSARLIRPLYGREITVSSRRLVKSNANFFGLDSAWAPSVDAETLAPDLFAASLFPYLVFLYYLHRSKQAPPLTLFGFYFLLVFVGATIPAGIYAKVHYETSLSNVDWLHGSAESFLMLTNLFIVLGLRQGIRKAAEEKAAARASQPAAVPQSAAASVASNGNGSGNGAARVPQQSAADKREQ